MNITKLKDLLLEPNRENDFFDLIAKILKRTNNDGLKLEYGVLKGKFDSRDANFNPADWKTLMLEFIKKFNYVQAQDQDFFYNLDRKEMKNSFRKATREQNLVANLFRLSDDDLSSESHKFIVHFFSDIRKTPYEYKGNTNDWQIDLSLSSEIEDLEADWFEFLNFCFSINTDSFEDAAKMFKDAGLDKNEHFLLLGLTNYDAQKFDTYLGFWSKLSAEAHFYLMFHVLDDSLKNADPQCHSHVQGCKVHLHTSYEKVSGIHFRTFFDLESCGYPRQENLIGLKEPVCIKQAKELLENEG